MNNLQNYFYNLMPDDMPNIQAVELSKKLASNTDALGAELMKHLYRGDAIETIDSILNLIQDSPFDINWEWWLNVQNYINGMEEIV